MVYLDISGVYTKYVFFLEVLKLKVKYLKDMYRIYISSYYIKVKCYFSTNIHDIRS